MRVGGDDERPRHHVLLLDHHLVPDAGARRIEVHPLFTGKRLDGGVFGQVLGRVVLDVVIEREHRLLRIVDARGSDGAELRHHRSRVVVGHHVVGSHREVITRDQPSGRPIRHVRLCDLLDDCLTHTWLPPESGSVDALPPGPSRAPELWVPGRGYTLSSRIRSVIDPSSSRPHVASLIRWR